MTVAPDQQLAGRATGSLHTKVFEVRLVLAVDGNDRELFERLWKSGIGTEGYGDGRVIAVVDIAAATDIDAVVDARERVRFARAPDPMAIASVKAGGAARGRLTGR